MIAWLYLARRQAMRRRVVLSTKEPSFEAHIEGNADMLELTLTQLWPIDAKVFEAQAQLR